MPRSLRGYSFLRAYLHTIQCRESVVRVYVQGSAEFDHNSSSSQRGFHTTGSSSEVEVLHSTRPLKRSTQEILRVILSEGQGAKYAVSDLSQLLKSWGRPDNLDLEQRKHLNRVEIALVSSIGTISPVEAANLLHTYALVGRLYPPIMNGIDEVLLQNVGNFPIPTLITAIWSSAKLNNRSAAYLPVAINRCFNHSAVKNDGKMLCKLLWSLAVLQKLNLSMFDAARMHIERIILESSISHVNMAQLHHVWNEVQLLTEELQPEGHKARDPSLPQGTPSQRTTHAFLPWQAGYSPPLLETPQSSLSHSEISRILRDLSVPHRNEVTLENGHIVDILMPMSAFEFVVNGEVGSTSGVAHFESTTNKMAAVRGVVIEYDGPFHFESYAKVSTLLVLSSPNYTSNIHDFFCL